MNQSPVIAQPRQRATLGRIRELEDLVEGLSMKLDEVATTARYGLAMGDEWSMRVHLEWVATDATVWAIAGREVVKL